MDDLGLAVLFWTIFVFGILALWAIVPFSLAEKVVQERLNLYLPQDGRLAEIGMCLRLALVMVLLAGIRDFKPFEVTGIGFYCVAAAVVWSTTRRRLREG